MDDKRSTKASRLTERGNEALDIQQKFERLVKPCDRNSFADRSLFSIKACKR
jgi:hypothetical protein